MKIAYGREIVCLQSGVRTEAIVLMLHHEGEVAETLKTACIDIDGEQVPCLGVTSEYPAHGGYAERIDGEMYVVDEHAHIPVASSHKAIGLIFERKALDPALEKIAPWIRDPFANNLVFGAEPILRLRTLNAKHKIPLAKYPIISCADSAPPVQH